MPSERDDGGRSAFPPAGVFPEALARWGRAMSGNKPGVNGLAALPVSPLSPHGRKRPSTRRLAARLPLLLGGSLLLLAVVLLSLGERGSGGARSVTPAAAIAAMVLLLAVLTALWRILRGTRAGAVTADKEAGRERLLAEVSVLRLAVPGAFYRLSRCDEACAELAEIDAAAAGALGTVAGALGSRNAWEAAVHPDDMLRLRGLLRRAREQGRAVERYRVRTADGGWRWLQDAVVLGTGHDGSCEAFGYLSDVTEDRLLEERLSHSSKLALLGELATSMAHELNQPLAIIGMAAENLNDSLEQGELNGEEGAVRLRRIAEQVERASAIIHHMRAFGRISRRDLGPVNLAAVVESVHVLLAPQLRAEQITVERVVPPETPLVRATQVQLEQVMMNLLLNARDAFRLNPRQSGARVIRLSAQPRGESHVAMTVDDNAGGIDPEVFDRIFEPFFSTKPEGIGTGLGLSVSRGLMEEFGGSLTARNIPGGAQFILDLPLWQEQPQHAAGIAPAAL